MLITSLKKKWYGNLMAVLIVKTDISDATMQLHVSVNAPFAVNSILTVAFFLWLLNREQLCDIGPSVCVWVCLSLISDLGLLQTEDEHVEVQTFRKRKNVFACVCIVWSGWRIFSCFPPLGPQLDSSWGALCGLGFQSLPDCVGFSWNISLGFPPTS